MIFDKVGNTSIITQEKASIVELAKKLSTLYPKYQKDNIIVNITTIKQLQTEDVLEFLQLSNQHRNSNYSFLIVTSKLDVDDIPDELMVVPTLQEAHDIIEMEEIERDLGL
ncbi:ribonuclease Z [Flavobacteriaceae sp. LMIT009]